MKTTARWWAPTEAHIGPDETDLEMLAVTGENPRLDLGGALLAVHRVGDAACMAAARDGLVNAESLVARLAEARLQLADPLVDAVSKCVSTEEESYAGLLVRDVFDDAEEAAVDLFRSAVARGVAPPVAAARAGGIYGVSKGQLGRYRQLATDPKANPLVVQAEADKVLMASVERTLDEEAPADARELVSKAPAAVKERIAVSPSGDTYYNVRDATGQFAASPSTSQVAISAPSRLSALKEKFTAQAQPVQAPAPAPAEPKKMTAAEYKRKQRLLQAKGKSRPKRKQLVAAEAKTSTEPQTRQSVKQSAKQLARQRVIQRIAGRSPVPRRTANINDYESPGAATDLLKRFPAQGRDFETKKRTPLGFVLDDLDAAMFIRRAQSHDNGIFRIGHLEKLVGSPPQEVDNREYTGDVPQSEYQDLIELVATAVKDDLRGVDEEATEDSHPDWHVRHFTPNKNVPDDPNKLDEWIRLTTQKYANMHKSDEGDLDVHDRAFTNQASDGTGYVTYVVDKGHTMPTVYEFILPQPRAWLSRHEIELDKNQAYRMPEAHEIDEQNAVYDRKNNVVRKRVYLAQSYDPMPLEVELEKAVATAPRIDLSTLVVTDDLTTPYYDGRDALGRFAVPPRVAAAQRQVQQSRLVQQAKPISVAEYKRKQQLLRAKGKRQVRPVVRPAQTEVGRQSAKQQTKQRLTFTPLGLHRLRQRQEELANNAMRTALPIPIEDHAYKLLTADEFNAMAHSQAGVDFLTGTPGSTFVINKEKDLKMLDAAQVPGGGKELHADMREKTHDLHRSRHTKSMSRVGNHAVETREDRKALDRIVNRYLRESQVGMVSELPLDPNGSHVALEVAHDPQPIVVIEFDESADPNGPYTMVKAQSGVRYDRSSDMDWTGSGTYHYRIPFEHWIAAGASEAPRISDYWRSRFEKESGQR